MPPPPGRVEEEGSRDGEVALSVTESKPPASGEGEGRSGPLSKEEDLSWASRQGGTPGPERRGVTAPLGALWGSLGILSGGNEDTECLAAFGRVQLGLSWGPGQALWKIRAGGRGLDREETVIGGWEGS